MPSPLVAGLMKSIEAIHQHANQFREEKKSALSKIDSSFFVRKWVFVIGRPKREKEKILGLNSMIMVLDFIKHGYFCRREKPTGFS